MQIRHENKSNKGPNAVIAVVLPDCRRADLATEAGAVFQTVNPDREKSQKEVNHG